VNSEFSKEKYFFFNILPFLYFLIYTRISSNTKQEIMNNLNKQMDSDDPFDNILQQSTIAQVLQAAREEASLTNPTRPYTPLDRSLFQYEINSRPSSAYSIPKLGRRLTSEKFSPIAEIKENEPYGFKKTKKKHGPDILTLDDDGNSIIAISDEDRSTEDQSTMPSERKHSSRRKSRDSHETDDTGHRVLPPKDKKKSSRRVRPVVPSEGPSTAASSGASLRADDNLDSSTTASATSSGTLLGLRKLQMPIPTTEENGNNSVRRAAALQEALETEKQSSSRTEDSIDEEQDLSGGEILRPMTGSKDHVYLEAAEARPIKSEWQQRFEHLVDQLWAFSPKDEDPYLELATQVDAFVEDVDKTDDDTAEILLRAVLSLLEAESSHILFRYAHIALKLLLCNQAIARVSLNGIHAAFLNIMKALFKFSKAKGNDELFLDLLPLLVDLIIPESILRSNGGGQDGKEALVFLLGALKNASLTSEDVQQALTTLGMIPKLLAMCGKQNDDMGNTREAQVLIQVTGLLRNISASPEQAQQFIQHNGFEMLTRINGLYSQHRELLHNTARVLSRLSLQPLIVQTLQESDESIIHLKSVARTLQQHGDYASICVRLMFFLGNVTAKSEKARILFMFECDGAALLQGLLTKYWKMDRQLAIPNSNDETQCAALEVEDVLTKIIRVIANIGISSSVGATVAATSALVEPLLDILGCKKIQRSEELVLNAVGCATNLLFYDVPANLLYLPENKLLLCRLFRPLLLEAYNSEAVMEAARALGNLSRHETTRQHIRELRIDEILSILLEHDDRDIVYYTCGVLVNLASDPACTERLIGCGVPNKLAQLLEEINEDDVDANACIIKVFSNLLLDPSIQWDPTVLESLHTLLNRIISTPNDENSEYNGIEIIKAQENTSDMKIKSSEKVQSLNRLVENLLKKLPAPIFACAVEGCGRRFDKHGALENHIQRRHAEAYVSTV